MEDTAALEPLQCDQQHDDSFFDGQGHVVAMTNSKPSKLKSTFKDRTRICFNMLTQDRAPQTLVFIGYKTIEANPGITLNQLRWLLWAEFLMPESVTDVTVGTLTSKSLFAAVSKWQHPENKNVIYLRVNGSEDVKQWAELFLVDYPEMRSFIPPIFRKKRNK